MSKISWMRAASALSRESSSASVMGAADALRKPSTGSTATASATRRFTTTAPLRWRAPSVICNAPTDLCGARPAVRRSSCPSWSAAAVLKAQAGDAMAASAASAATVDFILGVAVLRSDDVWRMLGAYSREPAALSSC